MATFTPAFRQNAAVCFQYGSTRSFHCQSSALENSGGHGETIQLGVAAFASAPGHPLKVMTVPTSSAAASLTVCSNTRWWALATAAAG